jgi:uncharacterized repeat protein (TIGR03803 family)
VRHGVLVSASVFSIFACAAAAQAEYKLTTLVTFDGTDGGGPAVGRIDASGNLYGAMESGGDLTLDFGLGVGTVFELAAGTHVVTTVATFNDMNGDFPAASLIADANGNLYGTTGSGGTLNGGVSGYGTVYELAADTHALNTLATFDYLTNGAHPNGGLVADARGNLYGTAGGGDITLNAGSGDGTVFKLAAGTHTLSTLATFNGTNGNGPVGGLVADASGNLYGTTFQGGANDNGTVFELAAGTHVLSTLATFNGTNGGYPNGGLIADANGNLYGTTAYGGANGNGTVFEVANDVNHTLSTLVTFNGANGASPRAGLIADASGNLYGTTSLGGDLTLNVGYGLGTVFEVAAGTHALTTLASFNGTNGDIPRAGLVADASGNLYGTTSEGGDQMLNGGHGGGTLFELSPVPEPSTLLLGALGAVSMFACRWWNRLDRSYLFPAPKTPTT